MPSPEPRVDAAAIRYTVELYDLDLDNDDHVASITVTAATPAAAITTGLAAQAQLDQHGGDEPTEWVAWSVGRDSDGDEVWHISDDHAAS